MADTLDVNAVNDIVRQAVEGINLNKRKQTLKIQHVGDQPLTLTERDVQHFTTFLQMYPSAVGTLSIERCSFTPEALEILRAYFTTITRAMSLRHIHFDRVNLGNVNGRRLLSGLQGNASVTRLGLFSIGLEGHAGGAILSELLQHNPRLNVLCCYNLRLGVEGARALQPGLRGNQTLHALWLDFCQLGDEGISVIVDALQGNTTMTRLDLSGIGITSNGLPNLTRLLQHNSLRTISLGFNPGLFDNQYNFGQFLIALQHSQVNTVSLNSCQLTGHAMAALFQAVALNLTITYLDVYDNEPLQGADLECLLEIIPQIQNPPKLCINVDFMEESVVSAFRTNTIIQHLYTMNRNRTACQEVTSGPVFDFVKRNRHLRKGNRLLEYQNQMAKTLRKKAWGWTMGHMARDSTGATAVFAVLREKLVLWWAPRATATAASPTRPAPYASGAAAAAPAAAAAAMVATSTAIHNTKRLRDQESTKDDDDATPRVEQGQEKRPRQS